MATSELIFVGVEIEGVFENLLHRAPLTPAAASASTNRYSSPHAVAVQNYVVGMVEVTAFSFTFMHRPMTRQC